jgi:hypothetical protein
MQKLNQTLVAAQTQVPSTPVELPLEKLGQVAGGTPKGTW